MKKLTAKKSAVLMLCLIMIVQMIACTTPGKTVKLDGLVGEIYEDASEPAKKSDELLAPGDRAPVDQLKIADDLPYLDEKVSIDITENENDIVYAYFRESQKLVLVYSNENGSITVTLNTAYGSCDALCGENKAFEGTVESIDIVAYFDYHYPLTSFESVNDCSAPNTDSTSCYGVIRAKGSTAADVCYDGAQFEEKGHADPIKVTFERFGIE